MVQQLNLVKACQQCLGEEAEELQGSLVYLDEGAIEAFHFAGGLPFFLQIGLRAVCQLENASSHDSKVSWIPLDEALSKIVIVTSQLLSDAHRYILRCFRTHPTVRHFAILSSISQESHSSCGDTPLGTDAFSEYRDLLLQDVLKEHSGEYSITIKHLPLICCCLTPRVFVLPSASAFATAPLSSKKEASFLCKGLPAYDNGFAWDEDELPPSGATLHAHFLHHLGAQLDLKFDIFSLGPVSHMVGKQLTEISSDSFGRATRPAALLLIDRSLDLITPTSHEDSLFDRLFSSLRVKENSTGKRPRHDVQIPSVDEEKTILKDGFLIGSLSSGLDTQEAERLDILIEKRTKDGALLVKKWIKEALKQENIDTPEKSRLIVNANELRACVNALLKEPGTAVKNSGIIQLAKATVHAIDTSKASRWEAFASAERVLALSASDSVESLLCQVQDLVRQGRSFQKGGGMLSLRDALTIIIVAYALAGEYSANQEGPFSWDEERKLKEEIMEAILEGPTENDLGFLNGLESALETHWQKAGRQQEEEWSEEQWEDWDAEDSRQQEYTTMQLKLELNDRIDELFNVLHKVAETRMCDPLRHMRLVAGAPRGVMSEIFSRVLAKQDIPGLKHHASKVGRLIKSGLGRFGIGQTRQKLSDHKVLVVFVIGGLNAQEVREARALQGEFEELLIGGTTFLTPDIMYDLLLGSNR